MTAKDAAKAMMVQGSTARQEAEKMMGKDFHAMTPAERVAAAQCLAAFAGVWNR